VVGEIVWLWRYPVKSMLGEPLTEVDLDESGISGDRRYALIDTETGLIASAKHPAKWRRLLSMRSRYDGQGRVVITVPNGTDVSEEDALLSEALGRSVRLTRSRPEGARIERLTPPTEANAGVVTRGALAAGTPGDSFVDFAAVHMVTTATLDALGRDHPSGSVDARRFRPNIVLRMYDDVPFVENTWVGRHLTIGDDVRVRIVAPTPRCVVPTLAHGTELAEDRHLLRTAARLNRVPVLNLGTLTCVGAYGSVRSGGRLRVGDLVQMSS
jgi:uncharacterized protein